MMKTSPASSFLVITLSTGTGRWWPRKWTLCLPIYSSLISSSLSGGPIHYNLCKFSKHRPQHIIIMWMSPITISAQLCWDWLEENFSVPSSFESHHKQNSLKWKPSNPPIKYVVVPKFIQIHFWICINEISLQTKLREERRRKLEIKKCTLSIHRLLGTFVPSTLQLECFKYSSIFAEFSIEACSANLTLYWTSSSSTRSYTAFTSRSQHFN